ncbi:Uncharacterised protein [Mycobacteroides abscessus]|nr:Uncharacterised protein [Mycobacteroides abscessus]
MRSARRTPTVTPRTYPTTPSCMSASRRSTALEPQKNAAFHPSFPCWIGP